MTAELIRTQIRAPKETKDLQPEELLYTRWNDAFTSLYTLKDTEGKPVTDVESDDVKILLTQYTAPNNPEIRVLSIEMWFKDYFGLRGRKYDLTSAGSIRIFDVNKISGTETEKDGSHFYLTPLQRDELKVIQIENLSHDIAQYNSTKP